MRQRLRQTTETVDAAAIDLRRRETPAEKLLWTRLRNRQLDGLKFRRQHPISRYVLDFYCAGARLGIELDGVAHADQQEMDQFRTDFLAEFDIRVFRFSNCQVTNDIEAVIQIIADVCAIAITDGMWRGSPSPASGEGVGG